MEIKQEPEDFVVKEKLKLPLSEGPYAYYLLRKTRWNTKDAVSAIAERLGINEKNITVAGIKDRQAVTEQHIAIFRGKKEHENLKIKDLELKYLGNGSERIHTGLLEGNEFELKVREIDNPAEARETMPNYFDTQRFGVNNTNAEVGKALVMKEFQKACELLGLEPEDRNYVDTLKNQKLLTLYLHSYQSLLFNLALSEYIKQNYKYKETDC